MGGPKDDAHENRLAKETSPYLLQHAKNPVNWFPWGPEALKRAEEEDRPILLSIGYAACHWCHVMERESFENEDIAEIMNRHFVCIKVDREERPDLDEIYMTATVAMNGSGGWPMTAFLTPGGEPFFTGTYFPPEDRYGRPGFPRLLERIADLWKNDRGELLQRAESLTKDMRTQAVATTSRAIQERSIIAAVSHLEKTYDKEHGGFGPAPKFPPCAAISLLFIDHVRRQNAASLAIAAGTLDGMKNGGMYDQIGGGFSRYSTDERWLVPHFEKMLYDNALLAKSYLEAYQLTDNPEYARVATETLDYVIREMQGTDGGYFSAQDADSDGIEGKFYVWSRKEVLEVLGPETGNAVCAYFDVTEGGNWEGQNVLNTPRTMDAVANELSISVADLQSHVERAKRSLYQARAQRVAPLCDDKALTAWNALMMSAMALGYRVFGQERFRESAERAAEFVNTTLSRPDRGLYRTARAGHAHLDAYLEDYAYLADALIDVYEATGKQHYLDRATSVTDRMLVDFGDPNGGAFFNTAENHETLLLRHREGHDGAIPNPNAVAARALTRLSVHWDRPELREIAGQVLQAYGRQIDSAPRGFCTALTVADALMAAPIELTFAGAADAAPLQALKRAASKVYLPHAVMAYADGGTESPTRPLTQGKEPLDGKPALYICRDYACDRPITDENAVGAALLKARSEARSSTEVGRRLKGKATALGTSALAAKHQQSLGEVGYVPLGASGLCVSRVGFGGARTDERVPAHREALVRALRSGINLLDTSAGFVVGRSERLIGDVLAELVSGGELDRSSVIVVSKLGYVHGEDLQTAKQMRQEVKDLDYTEFSELSGYCMDPRWLRRQLELSLERLGLEHLDVCLIHDPERLSPPERSATALRIAFQVMEELVSEGKIGTFGVASGFGKDALPVSQLVDLAEETAGAHHHFRVVELPLNLMEGPGTGDSGKSQLEAAVSRDVSVFATRPLSARMGDQAMRLVDPPEPSEGGNLPALLQEVQEMEAEFRRDIAVHLRSTDDSAADPASLFNWGDQLASVPKRVSSYEEWAHVEKRILTPQLHQVVNILNQAATGALQPTWAAWRDRYMPLLATLSQACEAAAIAKSQTRARALHDALNPRLPESLRAEPLYRKALATVISTPGVTSTLVGMTQPAYVDGAVLTLVGLPGLDPQSVYQSTKPHAG